MKQRDERDEHDGLFHYRPLHARAPEGLTANPDMVVTVVTAGAAPHATMPLSTGLEFKRRWREERERRKKAEAELAQVKAAFEQVMDGLAKRGQG